MGFPGGQYNPLIRATKFTKIYKQYQKEKNDTSLQEGIGAEYNPSVFSVVGVDTYDSKENSCVPLGRGMEYSPSYGEVPRTEFQSGMIYVDPNLRLMQALHAERDLLFQAGLQFDPNDDIRVIKDAQGNLKGAVAISYCNMGQIVKIRYIDVDENSENAKNSILRLVTNPGQPIEYHENAEIIRDMIQTNLIVEDPK